ncbi:MAG TPA: helix-turn-helix transcriptional regulator [Actinophytocola sp.]|uniref:helix-turn-helix domain-containing protein n=1 Tax=Actinophytocola sp. TaxID=1872138 RepID=UPI002DBA7CF6|nr:helix-turn-helix transcriptional regulator [Actinophytocola sp.]HEU5472281.1 helix-turn-helix transcriptional regulator [Actinophytocola sp.]
MVAPSPTVLKRYVALELRRLREAAGFKRVEVARRAGCATSHITHLEVARNLPKIPELELLLRHYGAAQRIPAFLDLLEEARAGRDWWLPFADVVPAWFELFLGLEATATEIASYDALVIPSLFQTPDYAEHLIRSAFPGLPNAVVAQRVELRMARQDVLTRDPDPPTVDVVLDESALYRLAGEEIVLTEQLNHLLKVAESPAVTIRVLPLSAGVHAGVAGTFVLLTFPERLENDPGVVYTEDRVRGTYHDDPEAIARYRTTLSRLRESAYSVEESRATVQRRIEELSQ